MESRHDSENAERILYNIQLKQLVRNPKYMFDVDLHNLSVRILDFFLLLHYAVFFLNHSLK